MHSKLLCLYALGISGLMSSCGKSAFKGKSETENGSTNTKIVAAPAAGAENEAGPESVKGGEVEVSPATDQERQSIGQCKKVWGGTSPDFSFDSVRKIKTSVSIGSKGVTLRDETQSSGPTLTLIYAGVNVGGEPTWELQNKNGWYCLLVNVNVAAKFTIKIASSAKLADSRVIVNVGSQTNGEVASVGVNVGSDIKVERLP